MTESENEKRYALDPREQRSELIYRVGIMGEKAIKTSNWTSSGTSNSAMSSDGALRLLSELLIGHGVTRSSASAVEGCLNSKRFDDLWTLATSHHVILRAFPRLHRLLAANTEAVERIELAITKEQARVNHALSFLAPICLELEEAGDVVVIKSLDHWPDLGSDLDLYTNAEGSDVIAIMRRCFQAQVAERSWGDRLANKWNFIVPGLPELVEVHVARLGQTGEQTAITQSLIARSRMVECGSQTFKVPAPEDRMIISTLQRMYRHFYLRLCDVVDNAELIDGGVVDYTYLKSLATEAGLWAGLATYLVIVAEYVESYRGEAPVLPALVADAARFGNKLVQFRKNFLRVPIFPQAAGLYASEWKSLLLNGELQSTLRLSLLPGLATAAALELKLTGSDKGIW
jgi:hypothetical protein